MRERQRRQRQMKRDKKRGGWGEEVTKRTYRQRTDSAGRGEEGEGARKEQREEVWRRVKGDKPRWNCDDAKFGKRRRLLCVCVCVHVGRLAESAVVPVSRLWVWQRERERERESLASNVPSGRTDERVEGWKEGRREVKGDEAAGRKGDKVREENLYLPLHTHTITLSHKGHAHPFTNVLISIFHWLHSSLNTTVV